MMSDRASLRQVVVHREAEPLGSKDEAASGADPALA